MIDEEYFNILNEAQRLLDDLESRQDSGDWERLKDIAKHGMTMVWPTIKDLKRATDVIEKVHSSFQAIHYEAERHLIPITKIEPAKKSASKDLTKLFLRINKLPKREREALKKLLINADKK